MKKYSIVILPLVLILFFSCRKEKLIDDQSAKLTFSVDTVIFDTVFTNIASVTKYLKVYNPHKQPIKISSIYLANGRNSNFRLNINGIPEYSTTDLILQENDSMFIFVEVTVNPGSANTPFVIQDSIVFTTNGSIQDVDLVAWGQDAYYHNGEIIGTETWINDKPHLVYNSMAVDSAATLTIEEGTQIHFHKGSRMYVFPTGNLIVNGTKDNPVVFQGDRLESIYDEIPGQWVGIWMWGADNSTHNINYAVIKNAIIGIQIDTLNNLSTPSLNITNTVIQNMNAVGLLMQGSNVYAANCVFANCGQYAVACNIGGYYDFYHCTMANYWQYYNRTSGTLLLNNYYKDINGAYQVRPLEHAYFGNCIIYGNKDNEVDIDEFPNVGYFNYMLENCGIKADEDFDISDINHFINVEKVVTPDFVDINENNYELDSLSEFIDKGNIDIVNQNIFILERDLNNEIRTYDNAPDLGAYERIE